MRIMDISKIKRMKTFVEGGVENYSLDLLSKRYSEQYNKAISMFDVIVNSDRADTIYKDGIAYKCLVDYGNPMRKTELGNINFRTIREIRTKITDDIKAGDVIEFKNKHSGRLDKYLILKTLETKYGYNLSVMDKCNHVFKWQSEQQIYEQPCIVFSRTSYKDDIYYDKVTSVASGQYEVYITRNELTENFSINRRFFIGRDTYEIAHIDELTLENILILTMNYSLKKNIDNEELGIADYFDHNEFKEPPEEKDEGGSLW